jgi:gluconate 2-dehydrogenase alpha chain
MLAIRTEVDYGVRHRMMTDVLRETCTLHYPAADKAYPVRQLESFLPGSGTGAHSPNASCRTRLSSSRTPLNDMVRKNYRRPMRFRIGSSHATRLSRTMNVRGKLIEQGNIFKGARSTDFPTPANTMTYYCSLFGDTIRTQGYHLDANPTAFFHSDYTNPDGVTQLGYGYCGLCTGYRCMIGAKAQPTTVL